MLKYIKKIHLSESLRRFPVASVTSVIATALCFYLISYPDSESTTITLVFKLLICTYLLFLASISIRLFCQTSDLSLTREALFYICAGVLAVIGFMFMPSDFDLDNVAMFRLPYYLVGIAFFLHLVVSYIPFLRRGENGDFWEYNRRLFIRIVESLLFSLVLFSTLSLAILAIDKLFGIHVNGDTYQYLFAALIGTFMSWYFLSNFPSIDYDGVVDTPSKSVLVFGQFIMIPVTVIYLLILYAYAGKIALSWELPHGWIGQLSLWFSVIGVFTFLFTYFNDRFSQLTFVEWYKKYFFVALIIPVVLLFVSISKRLSDYGFSELRYVLLLLTIWLTLMVILYGLLRIEYLKWIPISLSAVILFALFGGPLNLFSVTISSQSSRLYEAMNRTLLWDGGKFSSPNRDTELYNPALMNQLRFIDDRTDMVTVNNWLLSPTSLYDEDSLKPANEESNALRIARQIGLQITDRYIESEGTSYFNYYTDEFSEVDIVDYDLLYPFDIYNSSNSFKGSGLSLNGQKNQLEVHIDERIFIVDMGSIELYGESPDQTKTAEELTLHFEEDGYRFKILFKSIHGHHHLSDRTVLMGCSGILLIDRPTL